MIRLAMPKGRNQAPALAALRAAGVELAGLDTSGRQLWQRFPDDELDVLLLKDADLPTYVEQGVADWGIVGSDVLEESRADLLVPLRLQGGRSRLSLVGRPGSRPAPGTQVRLATKYPRTARRYLGEQSWSAEVVTLAGSVELAPLLDLVDVALDIVQTGATIRAHGLVELERVATVAPCVVVNRSSLQGQRAAINRWIAALEMAEVAV